VCTYRTCSPAPATGRCFVQACSNFASQPIGRVDALSRVISSTHGSPSTSRPFQGTSFLLHQRMFWLAAGAAGAAPAAHTHTPVCLHTQPLGRSCPRHLPSMRSLARTHAHTHTCTHAHAHTRTHAYVRTCVRAHANTSVCVSDSHAHVSERHTRTCTRAHTHAHSQLHTRARTSILTNWCTGTVHATPECSHIL